MRRKACKKKTVHFLPRMRKRTRNMMRLRFLTRTCYITAALAVLCSTMSLSINLDNNDYEDLQELYDEIMDETTDLLDIWGLYECEQTHEKQMPIPTLSTWAFLRGAYIATVGYSNSSIPYCEEDYCSGFMESDAVTVKYHPTKGRAVYANRAFQEGDLIYDQEYEACFMEGRHFRHFLASIPPSIACDVLSWAYAGPSYGACVDLDEGSLVNHASATEKRYYWESQNDRPNMHMGSATRNILVGDEILVDYMSFDDDEGWVKLGLGGWGEEVEDHEL